MRPGGSRIRAKMPGGPRDLTLFATERYSAFRSSLLAERGARWVPGTAARSTPAEFARRCGGNCPARPPTGPLPPRFCPGPLRRDVPDVRPGEPGVVARLLRALAAAVPRAGPGPRRG